MKTIKFILTQLSILIIVRGGLHAQNNAISLLWAENRAVQTTPFGTPSFVDNQHNYYRSGTEQNTIGGTDTKLQKWDIEGSLLWDIRINTSSAHAFQPTSIIE